MRTGFWSRFSIIFQILLSVCTVFAGSVTFAYFLMRHDYEASAWGLFAAFFALVVTHLHVLFLRNDLDDWYDPNSFDPMKYMSIVFLISGLITTGANLFLAVQKREKYQLDSHYPAAIGAFVCSVWCLVIILSARKYKRYVQMCQPILQNFRL